MNQWLLWSRFAAINLFGLAGLALAWVNGWIDTILEADSSGICIMIFVLFVIGLAATAWKIEKVTSELDHIERGQGGRLAAYRGAIGTVGSGNATRALELRLFGRITFVRHIANTLVMLGLIGTVVGFVMALKGIDASGANDTNAIGSMVGSMIHGMGVALYTTLVGSVLNLWLGANYQILATGTANLAAALIDRAHDAGPGAGAPASAYASGQYGTGGIRPVGPTGEAAHV